MSFAGIGTTSGDYTTFVTSDDEAGAYSVGQEMAKALKAKGWNNAEIGLIQISQARQNGVKRTNGFVKAVTDAGHKIVARNEMQLYTADETYRFVQDMLTAHPNLRGIFVQTDTPTLGAVRAVAALRRGQIPSLQPSMERQNLCHSSKTALFWPAACSNHFSWENKPRNR